MNAVGGSTLMTLTYGYDSANQLTSYAGPDGSITYGYDVDGQLTGATGAHNETYTYDKEGNRTMSGYVTSIGNRLTSDGTYSYTYDQDGNMLTQTRISDDQVTSYTWDFRNRLTEVLIKTSGGTTVQDDKFTYEIENRRIGKNTLSGGQSWTAYVDQNPFMDFNSSGTLLYRYIYGNAIDSLLGRIDTSGNAMWYLMDKLGSVRENTDGSGNVLDSITYDTYGNILAENHPTSGDRFKYTSREWDSEIGQYFYRARYYGPAIGRFESEDPLGFKGGDSNLFRYVNNHPATATDPKGLTMADPQVPDYDKGWTAQDWNGEVKSDKFPKLKVTYTARFWWKCEGGKPKVRNALFVKKSAPTIDVLGQTWKTDLGITTDFGPEIPVNLGFMLGTSTKIVVIVKWYIMAKASLPFGIPGIISVPADIYEKGSTLGADVQDKLGQYVLCLRGGGGVPKGKGPAM
jgi:RHS repeat-associated protein